MSRVSQVSQRQRTQNNPLVLGSFDETSLRVLTGTLGPKNVVVGYADTNQYSNGGFGGGSYNHWYQINLTSPAWIITSKGEPRPTYIQISVYDLNKNLIEGRGIFQGDSVSTASTSNGIYYPYIDHVMGAPSDLYNTFNPNALGKGDDRYFALDAGSYLLCVSTTRNELLNYTLALVIEVVITEMLLLLEDLEGDFLTQEIALDSSNTLIIASDFTVNYLISFGYNAFSFSPVTINNGITVTVPLDSTWFISTLTPESDDVFIIEPSDTFDFESIHEHSRAEWLAAWRRERSPLDTLPVIFEPLITTS
jgi:hypothetical protein